MTTDLISSMLASRRHLGRRSQSRMASMLRIPDTPNIHDIQKLAPVRPSFQQIFDDTNQHKKSPHDSMKIHRPQKNCLIVCFDKYFGFARDNVIPWNIKEDFGMFLDVTKRSTNGKKNVILMGKNTWYALPDVSRGLKDRINMVVSSSMTQQELLTSNVTKTETYLWRHLNDAINSTYDMDINNVFIGGGYEIYREALKKCFIDEIYLTVIDHDFKCDRVFPWEELQDVLDEYNIVKDKTFDLINNADQALPKYPVRFIKLVHRDLVEIDHYHYGMPSFSDNPYLNLLDKVYRTGERRLTRNGYTYSLFGQTIDFDLKHGFPLLTTKNVSMNNIFQELMFFIKGQTNTNLLKALNVNIWNQNTTREFLDSVKLVDYEEGDMGPMYGFQWRHFGAAYAGMNACYDGMGVDQLKNCIELIKTDPHSRRIIMTTFNPAQAAEGCLYPCHGVAIQFYVEGTNRLSCMMNQRSADLFLGVPYNIASYALLLHMICEVVNAGDKNIPKIEMVPGRLVIVLGDVHIYESHLVQVVRQLLREPIAFPEIKFNRKVTNIEDFQFEDITLENYKPYPNIPAKMVA